MRTGLGRYVRFAADGEAQVRLSRRPAPQRHNAACPAARRAPGDQRLLGPRRPGRRGPAPPDRLPERPRVRAAGTVRLRARDAPDGELAARLGAERRGVAGGVVSALGPLAATAAGKVAAEPAQDEVPAGALSRIGVRRDRPPPDSRVDPDRKVAGHAALRPAVRALAPLSCAVRRRPGPPRAGARPPVRAARARPGDRAPRDIRVPRAR